jgi:non-specific serine/threonine protein kinase/serine/threonine-protein kinase
MNVTAKEIVAAAEAIQDPAERARYVNEACAGNEALVVEVGKLLAANTVVTLEAAELPPNSFIGPYKLTRQIGEGGMGVVYQAQQSKPIRRDVALKVIKPGMDSRQVIARFEAERQALALMDHPNIARVFDAGATSEGRLYFAMELVEGGSSITHFCDARRLTIKKRIELYIPVCQAIQHAHQKGVIHRDIKPSNVLVTEREGRPVPKVIDFGLAKALGHQMSDATQMTRLGGVVGTLEYMSPEQAELTRNDVDTRSDVYSLGAVLYELLAGTPPLVPDAAAAGYVETLRRLSDEDPRRPSARARSHARSGEIAAKRRSDPIRFVRQLRGELDWIVMKALEKDRTRRYETVSALASDLERYLAGAPVEAGPPSATYRARKFVTRHRLGFATGAAFAVLLVAGSIVSGSMAIRASRAEAEARAVTDFLRNDVLAQASTRSQVDPDTRPDPAMTVRTALDRAAARIEDNFASQPLVEASIRQTIAATYSDLGLYEEAEQQAERAAVLRKRELGEEHPDTFESVLRLASAYVQQGKYSQAEPILAEALDLSRRALSEDHPTTLTTISSLAALRRAQNRYAEAEPLFIEALEGRRRLFGEEHRQTLDVMTSLAHLYYAQGKYAEAEALLVPTLEIRRRILGEEHPDTLSALNNLGVMSHIQNKYGDARRYYGRALEIRRRVSGDDHPSTLLLVTNLAELHQVEGDYGEAESLFAQALEGRRKTLGESHLDTLLTAILLGDVRLQQRKYAEAEAVARDASVTYAIAWPDRWERYYCESSLGASLVGQSRFAEAEPLLLFGYEGMVQRQAAIPEHKRSYVIAAGTRIVDLYEAWGKPEQAAGWTERLAQPLPPVAQ